MLSLSKRETFIVLSCLALIIGVCTSQSFHILKFITVLRRMCVSIPGTRMAHFQMLKEQNLKNNNFKDTVKLKHNFQIKN